MGVRNTKTYCAVAVVLASIHVADQSSAGLTPVPVTTNTATSVAAGLVSACPDGAARYAATPTVDPARSTLVSVVPTLCPIYTLQSASVDRALASGVTFSATSGTLQIDQATMSPNAKAHLSTAASQASADVRMTATLVLYNSLTRAQETVMVPLQYRFRDSAPLSLTGGGTFDAPDPQNIWDARDRGAIIRARTFRATGGLGIKKIFPVGALQSYLRLNVAGELSIVGAPLGYPSTGDYTHYAGASASFTVLAEDDRGRTITTSARLVFPSTRDLYPVPQTCFVFVHGQAKLGDSDTVESQARKYWRNRNRKARLDSTDVTMGIGANPTCLAETEPEGACKVPTNDFIDVLTNNETDASGYRASGQAIQSGNTVHSWVTVGYDDEEAYYDVSREVAETLVAKVTGVDSAGRSVPGACAPQTERVFVVAHSMGGNVMSHILSNASTSAPEHRPVFADAAAHVDAVVTLNSPLQGSEASDVVCQWADPADSGSYDRYDLDSLCDGAIRHGLLTQDDDIWGQDWDAIGESTGIAPTVCARDKQSTTRHARYRLSRHGAPGSLPVPVHMVAGHSGIRVTQSPFTYCTSNRHVFSFNYPYPTNFRYGAVVENDGAVNTLSQLACSDDLIVPYSHATELYLRPQCSGATVFGNMHAFAVNNESHDTARNASMRGVVQNPNAVRGMADSSHIFFESISLHQSDVTTPILLNNAQALRCVFGGGYGDQGAGYQCPNYRSGAPIREEQGE